MKVVFSFTRLLKMTDTTSSLRIQHCDSADYLENILLFSVS